MPQEAVAHLNMARCYLYRGDFASCEQHLDSALECCQLFNLVAARAETFETYGNLYRERGEIERAVEYYGRAARAYDEAGIALNRTELFEERALLSLRVRRLRRGPVADRSAHRGEATGKRRIELFHRFPYARPDPGGAR